MSVLFESSAGYAIFKLLDEDKFKHIDDLYIDFQSPETSAKVVELKHFQKFEDTTEAFASATSLMDGKLCETLKKIIKSHVNSTDILMVADPNLGKDIQEKLNIRCVSSFCISELLRCIRSQFENLLVGHPKINLTKMSSDLAHSLSAYKFNFRPDNIDTMIPLIIGLLDEVNQTVYNYVLRCRERYGCHFPELGMILTDDLEYVKMIKTLGMKENAKSIDLSSILSPAKEEQVKTAVEKLNGIKIAEDDLQRIILVCDEVLDISNYRTSLFDYLKSIMMTVAPNLTVLVGDFIAARIIARAGSLKKLTRIPAYKIKLCGAEKALYRDLETKKYTNTYGIIYHYILMGKATAKNIGKMAGKARKLARDIAIAARNDRYSQSDTIICMELGGRLLENLHNKLRLMKSKISETIPIYKIKLEDIKQENDTEVTLQEIKQESETQQPPLKKFKNEDKSIVDDDAKFENFQVKVEVTEAAPGKKKKKSLNVKYRIF